VVLVISSLALVALEVANSPLSRRTVLTGLTVLVLMPAVILGQYAPPPYRLRRRWRWWLLGAQALLTYLPLLLFQYRWLGLLGFLAGAVLLTLPPTTSVPLATAVAVSGPVLVHAGLVQSSRSLPDILLSTAVTASAVFAVAHLALLAARLHGAQEQAARLAQQRERARMRRDLHDVVGSSLTAITVLGESVLRTDSTLRGATRSTLTEILGLTRRIQDDVRFVSHPDSGTIDLAEEVVQAQRVLTASGILVRTTLSPGPTADAEISDWLRSALREAVGNVLEHSRATQCEIALSIGTGSVELSVRNNRAGRRKRKEGRGSGLLSLNSRALVLGGTFSAHRADGWFHLRAVLPTSFLRHGKP
jgi:two-component system sensor histidine kinase DesK